MKLSNQQAQLLMQVLCDSLKVNVHNNWFSFSEDARRKLYVEIIDQQNKEAKELDA